MKNDLSGPGRNFINIKCNDATPQNTKITHPDGTDVKGVRSIDIRFRLEELVTAKLDIYVNEINIQAEPLLSFDTVKRAAEYYGYELVVKGSKNFIG